MVFFKQKMENLAIQMDLNNIKMWRGLMLLLKKNVVLKNLPM
jgi:hypothetical protein